MERNRRRPGANAPADDHVTQRELDAELRGISFKLKVVGAIAAINLPVNIATYLTTSHVTPPPVALLERLLS